MAHSHQHHHHARRRTWDLSQLSTKYPWLRVDSETLEEFRSPFQWVRDDDDLSSSDSGSSDEEEAAPSSNETKRRRSHRRYSLADPAQPQRTTRQRSPRKRPRPEPKQRRLEAVGKKDDVGELVAVIPTKVSPRSARSETDHATDEPLGTSKIVASPPVVLPSSVYADFQALKAEQRARQHQLRRPTKSKAHNILSLSFPVLHKPVVAKHPEKNVSDTNALARQRSRLHSEELALHERLRARIEREKARLPLTFLFERNLDKTYCKQQSVATITSIFAKLQHRLLFHAFQRWMGLCNAQRDKEKREAAIQQAQTRALAFFERLASDAYVGTLARAFTKWREAAAAIEAAERERAATTIQGLFRQRRARALLKQLKQASLDREYKRAMELQRLLAFEAYGTAIKWKTLKHGFNLVLLALCARRITFFFRRLRTRKRIARRVQRQRAAVVIQCRWRMKLAWLTRKRLQLAREIQRERERAATVHMQRRARGYLARQHAALRRVQLSNANVSARVIQRAWRRHRDYEQLRIRFQRRRLLQDELARIEAARRDEARRDRVAVEIQRVVRGFIARREAARRRHARALDRAARRVQQSWRKSTGRYALHVRFAAQRERLTQRRMTSALLVQCRFRMHRARRQRDALVQERQRRRQSAVAIQRVARGRHARHVLATQRRASVAIQSAWRGKLAREERERRRQARELAAQQRYQATLRIQCVARGHRARRLTRQLRSEQQQLQRLLEQSAVLIQKRARGIEARKVAALLRQALQVVDAQQRRAYAHSTQQRVNESALLAFVTQQSIAAAGRRDRGDDDDRDDEETTNFSYSREQLQLIQWQIDAARQQMAREDRAVVVLQRRYRGYVTRVQFVVLQLQRRARLALELQKTRVLQRVARGFLARRRVHRLRAKRRGEELKEAYVRERKWKEQARAFEDQYKQEQMALQLQRLQALETAMRDAKREAEIAKWQAEAAAARRQELQDQLEATRLARELRGASSSEEEEDEAEAAAVGTWAYVADAYGRWYYYNATTGESAWEKPAEPEAPRPKPKKEKKPKTEAKPTKETKPKSPPDAPAKEAPTTSKDDVTLTDTTPTDAVTVIADAKVPEGYCCKCKAVEADKECLDCLLPDITLDVLYCNACFTLEHNLLSGAAGGKGRHDFKVIRALQQPSACQHNPCLTPSTPPPARASYYCGACVDGSRFSCEACFPKAHETAQTSHHVPTALHFRAGALLCVECQRVLATRTCTQCDEAFCAPCFEGLHTQSKKDHEFTPLEILKDDLTSEKDAYCVDCEIRTCTKLCNLCGDGFCDKCFVEAHSKGHKTQHTWISWASFATHGDWLEIQDDTTGKTIYFNIETKESTHTQPFVLKSGDERHRVLFQEREAAMKKKALELESEIVKLKEQLQTVAHEKDQEIDRLKRRRRGADVDNENGEDTSNTVKPKKKGLLGGLFGGRKKSPQKKKMATPLVGADKKLTPDELKKLALQQSIQPELSLVTANLTTRERALKEEKAKQTIGTKHFEQAMLNEFVQGSK